MAAELRTASFALVVCLVAFGCTDDDRAPVDATPPSVPANVAASRYGSSRIDLSWTASTDNVGVAAYEIRRGGSRIGESTTTTYSATGLAPDSQYCHTVVARDGAGNSSDPSAEACATTGPVDTEAPSVPGGLHAESRSPTEVELSWNPSTDNVGVAGYDVFRGGARIGVSSTTTYEDTGLSPSSQYCYQVRAFDGDANHSELTPQACATTFPPPHRYTASGSYSYSPADRLLTMYITSSTFPCDGPQVGMDILQVESLSATELVIRTTDDGGTLTFTRSGGSSSEIAGDWHAEGPEGDSWDLVLRIDRTFEVVGLIQGSCSASAWSQHWPAPEGYVINLRYEDPDHRASQVRVTGPGIQNQMSLCYEMGEWNNDSQSCEKVSFGGSHPQPPLTYVFTIVEGTETRTEAAVVDCFIEPLPTNLSPTGFVTGSLVFSWTPISLGGVRYRVELMDSSNSRVWESQTQADISAVAYDGPPLAPGDYIYYVVAAAASERCQSFGKAEFTYTGRARPWKT